MQQHDPRADGAVSSAPEGDEAREGNPGEGESAQPRKRLFRLTQDTDVARPDAWLERRLRVFEHSLEILESQQKELRAEHRASLVRMDEGVTALKETLASLQSESLSVLPHLQDSVRNMRFRLDVVEAVASAALESSSAPKDETPVESAGAALPEAAEPVFVPDEPSSETAQAEESEPQERPEPTYLDLARKAASNAAAAAEETALALKAERARNLARYNRRLLTGIAFGVLAFVASAGISFHQGYMDGRAHAAENHSIKHKTVHKTALGPSRELERLAKAGNRDAQLLLALKYYPPGDGPKDASAARGWLMRSAKAGQPVAQYLFGRFEERGVAAPPDMAEALKWYEAAAWAGNRKAMNDLAVIFAQGVNAPANAEEAALWFYRAADNGSLDAQFNLAVLYERGLGVPQSSIHAYKWYSVAAKQGDLESRKRLAVLDAQMTSEDLAVARALIAKFSAKPLNTAANLLPDETKLLGSRQMAAR